jgi:uncharacterized protein YdeI (YjbR/CyaY-like superfamily)
MSKRNPEVDSYIGAAAPFARPILKHLRKIVHAGCPAVEETMKWGMPFFEYKGNLAHMAAFREHCAFGFWKRALLFGSERPAKREAMGQFGRITKLSDLPEEKRLLEQVRRAAKLNEAGIARPRPAREKGPRMVEVPADLAAALRKNVKARKTFDNFSYSNRKEYVDWINGAKREETRLRRLATAMEWMAAGKSQNWRYEARPGARAGRRQPSG